MQLRVEIKDPTVTRRSGTKDGRPWAVASQRARYHYKSGCVTEVDINIPTEHAGYPVGMYVLSDESYEVAGDRRLELRIGRYLVLEPEAARAFAPPPVKAAA